MANLLLQHAVENIWCEPSQDYQTTLGLSRLTSFAVNSYVNVLWRSISLPVVAGVNKPLFHVYQIGALPPDFFNIGIEKETWVPVKEVIEKNEVMIDIFFSNGCKIPVGFSYLRRNYDNNFILAVMFNQKHDYLGAKLSTDNLYARFYANAYYDSHEYKSTGNSLPAIKTFGMVINSPADFITFLNTKQTIENQYTTGSCLIFQEGFVLLDTAAYADSMKGKYLWFVFDVSIKAVNDFVLSSTPTFISQKDINVEKYLLISSLDYTTIDYFDDVDVYISFVKNSTNIAVYLGKLREENIRQVTHNTYSVSKRVVQEIANKHGISLSGIKIKLVIRQGGFLKGLKPQHNRIEQLYKLSKQQVIEAMTGATTVPEWYASSLENSDYIKIMGFSSEEIIDENIIPVVENGYGYNAATKVLANPICVYDNNPIPSVKLPKVLSILDKVTSNGKRVIYFYKDGLLKGFENNYNSFESFYIPTGYSDCQFVEAFNSEAVLNFTGNIYGSNVESFALEQYGFRCYVCALVNGIPNEEWVDVTDRAFYFYDKDGTISNSSTPIIEWDFSHLNAFNLFPCVKINNNHYVFNPGDLSVNYKGVIEFDLLEDTVWLGNSVTKVAKLPFGVLDVFIDGYSLFPNLDYFVKDGKVTIVKRPETNIADTEVFVRGYGFPNRLTMETDKPRDFAYVRGGILSDNGRYDIRNDRNIRTVVSGRVLLRNQVKFSENMTGSLVTDGKPYSITDFAVPVENFTSKNTVEYREEALDLDERVMDYLTPRLPAVVINNPVIEVERWGLVSPFISRIIHEFFSGFLNAGQLDTSYTDQQVDGWLANLYYLLEVDPCLRNVDHRYVIVYPHQYSNVVSVTNAQYRFLEYLIARFLNSRVDLTSSLFIE